MSSENTSSVSETAVTSPKSGDNKMIILAVAAALIVVVVVAAVLLFGRGGGAGITGKQIPSDWNKYENDVVSFGHPKDFDVDESSDTMLTVQKVSGDESSLLGGIGGMQVYFSNGSTEELSADNKQMIESVMGGDCSKLSDIVKESAGGAIDGMDFKITSNSVEFNNAKGCKYEASINYMGISGNVEGAALISKSDSKKAVSFTVSSFGGTNNDINVFRDIISTVSFK